MGCPGWCAAGPAKSDGASAAAASAAAASAGPACLARNHLAEWGEPGQSAKVDGMRKWCQKCTVLGCNL